MSTTVTATTTMESPAPSSPLDEIPPLDFLVLETHDEKTPAIKLITDSLAQERQTVATALIYHPHALSALFTCLGFLHLYLPAQATSIIFTAGFLLIYLMAIRLYTGPFLQHAETASAEIFTETSFVAPTDIVLAARYGERIIGTIVLRPISSEKTPSSKRRAGKAVDEVILTAWTTTLHYRRTGLGRDMVRYAVEYARKEYGANVAISWAPKHANAARLVSTRYMSSLSQREAMAERVLREELMTVKQKAA